MSGARDKLPRGLGNLLGPPRFIAFLAALPVIFCAYWAIFPDHGWRDALVIAFDLAALTNEVLTSTSRDLGADERVAAWEDLNFTAIKRARTATLEFAESSGDLAALSVLLRQIRTLVRTSAAT